MSKKPTSKNTNLMRDVFSSIVDVSMALILAGTAVFMVACVLSLFDKITIIIDK